MERLRYFKNWDAVCYVLGRTKKNTVMKILKEGHDMINNSSGEKINYGNELVDKYSVEISIEEALRYLES